MTIENIGAYMDLIQIYITSLSLGYTIYSGAPITPPSGNYGYFRLENNSEKVGDDSVGTNIKEATFDFIIASGNKSTPDSDLYESLNTLSNALVTQAGDRITLTGGFIIYSVSEGAQSGILRDINEKPYLIAQYKFIYQYRYNSKPRV